MFVSIAKAIRFMSLLSPNNHADQSSLRDRLPIKMRQRDAAIHECSTSLHRQQILSSAEKLYSSKFY